MNQQQPTKRQQQYAETLEAIRAAVDKLVNEIGFEHMRIQDICREVGISVGAFYHYFPSKNAIFLDRYRRRNAYYRALYETSLKDMHPVDGLKTLTAGFLKYILSRVPGVLRHYAKAIIDEYVVWQAEDGDAILEICTQLVKNGQERGQVSARYAPEDVAMTVNDYYRGVMVSESIAQGTDGAYESRERILFDWLETLRVE